MDRNKNAGDSGSTAAPTEPGATSNALIPTQFKSKIHSDFIYPIGAEFISEHLRGIPHFETTLLAFSSEASSPEAVSRKQLLGGKDEYPLITARVYGIKNPSWTKANPLWTRGWTLHVYPVRRDLKK